MMRSTRLEDQAVKDALRERLAVDVFTAARALAVSPESIRRGVRRGELPSAGVGRSFRVPTVALREKLGLTAGAAAVGGEEADEGFAVGQRGRVHAVEVDAAHDTPPSRGGATTNTGLGSGLRLRPGL